MSSVSGLTLPLTHGVYDGKLVLGLEVLTHLTHDRTLNMTALVDKQDAWCSKTLPPGDKCLSNYHA